MSPPLRSHCCLMGQMNEEDPVDFVGVCERYYAVGAPKGQDHGYCFTCGHDKGCHA